MTGAIVFRDIVLSASFSSAGLATYLALRFLRLAVQHRRRGDGFLVFYATLAGVYAIVVALVAELVFKAVSIEIAWRTVLYTLATAGGVVSVFGIAAGLRRGFGPRLDVRRE